MACAPQFGAPGDITENSEAILRRVREARQAGARLLLLPELSLSGGTCGEMFRHDTLLSACEEASGKIAAACGGMLCVFGLPVRSGRQVLNAAAVALNGSIIGFTVKQNLSPLERLCFSPVVPPSVRWQGREVPCATSQAVPVPGAGCAEAVVRFYDDLPLLTDSALPADRPVILLCPALHPYLAGRRDKVTAGIAAMTVNGHAVAYASAGANESTTDQVFAGVSVIARQGEVLDASQPFSGVPASASFPAEGFPLSGSHLAQPEVAVRAGDPVMPYAPPEGRERAAWCRECVEIAARGLATRMAHIHAGAAVLGVSGGLDSALALIIIKRAFEILKLDDAGIHAFSLPALGSSEKTGCNALRLIKSLGLTPRVIDLKESVLRHFEDIGHDAQDFSVVYENAQARERTQVLMDLANRYGGLMVGTGDLSELALGFATFGGDHLCMYGVNAGLYKSAIRLIIRQAVLDAGPGEMRDTLTDILETPISPELLPGTDGGIRQQTENILGPYLLNDFFLHHFLTAQASPRTLLELTADAFGGEYGKDEVVSRMRAFFTRFFNSQFKRGCMPDGPQVLEVSLSPRGFFLLPSDASADAWLKEIAGL